VNPLIRLDFNLRCTKNFLTLRTRPPPLQKR